MENSPTLDDFFKEQMQTETPQVVAPRSTKGEPSAVDFKHFSEITSKPWAIAGITTVAVFLILIGINPPMTRKPQEKSPSYARALVWSVLIGGATLAAPMIFRTFFGKEN